MSINAPSATAPRLTARRLSNHRSDSRRFYRHQDIVPRGAISFFMSKLFINLQKDKRRIYGNGEDKDGMVLQGVWKRKFEMDGQVPGLRGMEYYG